MDVFSVHEQTVTSVPAGVGSEPIPGYRLVERLGSGGYGEVWMANAPGGLAKAVKIIFGDLTGPRAEQELRSLERIKSVRHPFLLSLERFEVTGNQLIIVTELADRSLMQRFLQCRASDMPGIPRQELVGYLREAADALDFINETHGLQHLDIKPENLLLVGNHIKVADFGLVKNLSGASASITGGVTPIYATPEAFDGRASRFSDQYSLAIVFQEMLTGERPFNGTTPLQLVAQHTSAKPNLDSLPPADRPVIARALSKVPEQRYPLCRHMVESLGASQTAAVISLPPDTPLPLSGQFKKPNAGLKTMVGGPQPTSPGKQTGPPPQKKPRAPMVAEADIFLPGDVLVRASPVRPAMPARTLPAASPVRPGQGYRPTLYVGLGGLARRALQVAKRQLQALFVDLGHSQAFASVFRFLHLDTDRASQHQSTRGAGDLAASELLHCPLRLPEAYREQSADLLRWLPRRWLYGIPRSLRTEGLRPLGRLAFVDHAETILPALRDHLGQFLTPEAREASAAVGLRGEWPRVVVVAAITGGTGGGMLVDAARTARRAFAELHLPAEVCGLLMYANGARPDECARARINAHSTLQELWHWSVAAPTDDAAPPGPPFTDCYVVGHPSEGEAKPTPTSPEAVADRAAEYLCFDATIGGGCLERLRVLSRDAAGEPEAVAKGSSPMTLRGCGLTSLRFPRRRLIEAVAMTLSRQVVEGWRKELSTGEGDRLGQVARDWVAQQGVNQERLLERLLGRLPKLLTNEGNALHAQLSDGKAAPPAPGSVASAKLLSAIDEEFGVGPEPENDRPAALTVVEAALKLEAKELACTRGRAALARLRELVETPAARLRGAEVALGAIVRYLADEIQNLRNDLEKFRVARRQQRNRIQGQDGTKTSGLFPTKLRRFFKEATTERPVWNYYCLRVEELLADTALEVLVEVQACLSNWGQDLDQVRRKVAEFLVSLPTADETPATPPSGAGPSALVELWPYEAAEVVGARKQVLQHLPADTTRQLDERVQKDVLQGAGGLWTVMRDLGKESTLDVGPKVVEQAAAVVSAFLAGTDLTGLMRKRHGDGPELRQAIQERVRAAQKLVPKQGPWEHLVLVVPASAAEAPLRDAALETLVGVPVTVLESTADSPDTLLVAWETAGVSLPELAAEFAGEDPGVVELSQKVRTRQDVEWAGF